MLCCERCSVKCLPLTTGKDAFGQACRVSRRICVRVELMNTCAYVVPGGVLTLIYVCVCVRARARERERESFAKLCVCALCCNV